MKNKLSKNKNNKINKALDSLNEKRKNSSEYFKELSEEEQIESLSRQEIETLKRLIVSGTENSLLIEFTELAIHSKLISNLEKQISILNELTIFTEGEIIKSKIVKFPTNEKFQRGLKKETLTYFHKWLKEKKQELGKETNSPIIQKVNEKQMEKMKWKCSPALVGFIITELANKGFIDFPLHNGEINPTGLAKICFELFNCDTTKENLIKEFNQNKNTLSETKRAKFLIPELKDIQ